MLPREHLLSYKVFFDMPHFLKETDVVAEDLPPLFVCAREFKEGRNRGSAPLPLDRQSWGMLFHKNSTRTRVSFEVALFELGAQTVWLDPQSMQIGRGESVADTARVLSRYLHGVIIRTHDHGYVESFAREGSIPVVNALTDLLHPCQIYADVFTIAERIGALDDLSRLRGTKVVFLGDTSCNMAHSWLMAGRHFELDVVLSGPDNYRPAAEALDLLQKDFGDHSYAFEADPMKAVEEADFVYTDVWVSMGVEAEAEKRVEVMRPYAVTEDLMAVAPGAFFLHCMPTHPGWEVSQAVLDSDRAILFDQAENRLHMQKALLAQLACGRA